MFFFKKKKYKKIKPDWLILGLGNPGPEYANTRHNIGWMVANLLANKYKSEFKKESKLYIHTFIEINNSNVLVALPMTYMNNSGKAAIEIVNEFAIPIENIIVVLDEYNFPLGKIHVKTGGGDGGHNGMASIIEYLQSNEFIKLRCGIGKNFGPGELVNYVLSDFLPEEITLKNEMIKQSAKAIETIISLGKARAFSLINSGKL